MTDFDFGILNQIDHRPWPVPARPWFMTQTWTDLLFAHWALPVSVLEPRIPRGLKLDTFKGRAWIAVVPFQMSNVAARGAVVGPLAARFPEINVRTYVTDGAKPGVFFFSLDATNPLAVAAARGLFNLPYFNADIDVESDNGAVRYRCRRSDRSSAAAEFVATYRPTGPAFVPPAGSVEEFLTERYCLYVVDRRGRLRRLEIHHPPWPLQTATASIDLNTMIAAAGIEVPDAPSLLHFSKRQDVVAWWPETLSAARQSDHAR